MKKEIDVLILSVFRLLGVVMTLLGTCAIVGAVLMFTANQFGFVEFTWVQGTAVAASLKMAGALVFGGMKRGGA